MPTVKEPPSESAWWVAEYILICEEPPRGAQDSFEGRYRDQLKHQGPDDPVFGRVQSPRNVDVEHACLISEQDWETGMGWDAVTTGVS